MSHFLFKILNENECFILINHYKFENDLGNALFSFLSFLSKKNKIFIRLIIKT